MSKAATAKKRHWYRLHVGECPVCGRDASYRVRMTGKRPADRGKRVVYLSHMQTYCGCLEKGRR